MGSAATPQFVRLPGGQLFNLGNVVSFKLDPPSGQIIDGKPVRTGRAYMLAGRDWFLVGDDAIALDAYLAATGAVAPIPDVPPARSGHPVNLAAIDDVA